MEFGEAKKLVWENLTSAIKEFETLKEECGCNDIEEGWDTDHSTQKNMDNSNGLPEFLLAASYFYDEIKRYVRSKYYGIEQAEIMREVLIRFSAAIIRMLAEMYTADKYGTLLENGDPETLSINTLVTNTVFVLGAVLAKEKGSSEVENIADLADEIIFGKGKPLKEVYENLMNYCQWAIEGGITARDQYLRILLEYFVESDWGPTFVIEVNRLISPCDLADDAKVDSRVDDVIKAHFHKLSDQQKLDIIEQCTYRDINKDKNPCPKKVLEEKIRQHVVCMIETMWLGVQNGEQAAKDWELLKFHCIDCAYVSAKIKADLSEADGKFGDSHDTSKKMPDTFNIIISDIHVLVMKLKGEEIEIHVHGKRQGPDRERCCDESYKVPFSKDDWKLDKVDVILKAQNISRKVTEYCSDPDGSDFRYSLIYLENYRGIDHMSVSFDHKFTISRKENNACLTEETTGNSIRNFYGKKIISMTGFVGKNGAGKTSVVDFLRDSFLLICSDLYDGELTAEDGVINMKQGQAKKYRMKEDAVDSNGRQNVGTRFFVVFYFMGKHCYLTNMKVRRVVPGGEIVEGKGIDGLKEMRISNNNSISPYQIGEMLPLYRKNRRIVYFSQYLAPAGVAAREQERFGARGRRRDETEGDGSSLFTAGQDDGQEPFREGGIINLAEETFDAMRIENSGRLEDQLNIALFMQLVFYYCKKGSFKEYFGENFVAEDLEVSSKFVGELEYGQGTVKLKDLKGTLLEQVLKDPVAYIRPFSSGQYSKFVLLSRLFWCIKGWEIFPDKLSEQGFNEKEAFDDAPGWDDIRDMMVGRYLKKTDSAVLLFDEADVYYHPDWQREFVQDIMTMVEECSDIPLQIVFTTNAPLMLSDLQKRDIYLMKNQPDSNDAAKRESVNPSVQTFGQNIHTLMAKPFFLDRTIGKFADRRIGWLIGLMIDVSSIVSFLRGGKRKEEEKRGDEEKPKEKKKREEEEKLEKKKKCEVLKNLSEKHTDIYKKTMAIFKAVELLDSDADEKTVRKRAAEAERIYVAEEIRSKELADIGADEVSDENSYGLVLEFLQNHIKMIGEDVLRNELFDMFNDFRTRIDRGVKLETLIEQKEKELEELKKRQSEVPYSGESGMTE